MADLSVECVATQMADTLRAVLLAVDQAEPYPWQGGALKQQIREDITAYEVLGLDGWKESR
jgi:hypothetical protein